ncbi:MAG: EAL domain-containing protein, partial [Actinomycetota bacterium]|nr:EAL domain-containing protein [Actinomycetota bacterium]
DLSDQLRDALTERSRTDVRDGIPIADGNRGLFLAYQPEVDLRTGRIVAVEALVRWQHPQLGDVSPESFISLAEQSDLIIVLGTWVLDESLRQLAAWSAAMPDLEITLRVNVSPVQLIDDVFVPMVQTTLAEHHIAGNQLCIEITEHSGVHDVSGVRNTLLELRGLGVTSALDDLASGFSSLGRLHALPIDAVKIDRTLVSNIDGDVRARAIVEAILRLGESLGLEVVAEGVERAEEAATLLALGCRRAQGHRFGRPVDGSQMQQLLGRKGRGRPTGASPKPRPWTAEI